MAQAPAWATALVEQVAQDYGIEPPDLTWRRSRKYTYSSGHFNQYSRQAGSTLVLVKRGREVTYEGWTERPRITVTAGSNRTDQKHTVLHEMAHALTCKVPNLRHGAEFYALLGELLLRYGGTLKHLRFAEGWNGRSAVAPAIEKGLRLMRERRMAA